jgi:uncharacterized RDD family membrane protein YckC
MNNLVKLPNRRNRSNVLRRFWKRFVDYAKVGVCVMLVVFLFQTIALGAGAPDVKNLLFRAGMLLGVAVAGAAGVAAAHEFRRARKRDTRPRR